MPAILRIANVCSVHYEGRPDTNPASPYANVTDKYEQYLTFGTGEGQANTCWTDTREDANALSAGANHDIDLTNITKQTPAGLVTVSFACIKVLKIENLNAATTDYLKVGKVASVTNGWEGPFGTVAGAFQEIPGKGMYANFQKSAAGWVVDSTHKVLRINNPGANAISYKITLVGEA